MVSCGKGDPDVPPSPPPAASNPPSENPAEVTWTSTREEFTNDMIAPGDCDFPWRFTVRRDGSFTAGPCTSGDALVQGHITAAELADLSARANVLVDSDLTVRHCDDTGLIAADRVWLTLSNGNTWRIKDGTPEHLCFRDGRANAENFSAVLQTLLKKYYPTQPQILTD